MRFHVTLTHTPESGSRAYFSGCVSTGPTGFYVVVTDDYTKLYELFRPFQGIAKADISPVRDLMNPRVGPTAQ